jgi:hypothetical protein
MLELSGLLESNFSNLSNSPNNSPNLYFPEEFLAAKYHNLFTSLHYKVNVILNPTL